MLQRVGKLCCQLIADALSTPWPISPVFLFTTHQVDCCDRTCAACGTASPAPHENTAAFFSGSQPFGLPRIAVAYFSRSVPFGIPRAAVEEVCGTTVYEVFTFSKPYASILSLNDLELGRRLECLEELERHLRPMYAKGALLVLDWIQSRSE